MKPVRNTTRNSRKKLKTKKIKKKVKLVIQLSRQPLRKIYGIVKTLILNFIMNSFNLFSNSIKIASDLPPITHINKHYLDGLKKIPIKKPKNPLNKANAMPNLEIPHPGTSYNPDYDDHQDLLLKAYEIELKRLKEEQKLIRKMTENVKKLSWDEIETIWLEEMGLNGLFEPEDQQQNEEEREEEESRAQFERKVKTTKKNETKTKRDRKKLLEKINKRKTDNDKKIRIQQNEIFRLKTLKKEIADTDKKTIENSLKKEETKALKELYGTKRLGNVKYQAPELELKLSEEISGNLRNLKVKLLN
jgi:nucleolar protein 53